jgi:hypothetical protein
MREFRLPVSEVEVREGHHTLWVHAPDGTTLMRIKCTGKIVIDDSCASPVAHSDLVVQGDIHICVPADVSPYSS